MHTCPACARLAHITRLSCAVCGVSYEGEFAWPRLARLSREDQELAEQLVLVGGNLRAVAARRAVSYPTLRKRVDGLIARLTALREADEQRTAELLGEVERGARPAEQAARLLREMHGGQ